MKVPKWIYRTEKETNYYSFCSYDYKTEEYKSELIESNILLHKVFGFTVYTQILKQK